jgi:hypothetical protein
MIEAFKRKYVICGWTVRAEGLNQLYIEDEGVLKVMAREKITDEWREVARQCLPKETWAMYLRRMPRTLDWVIRQQMKRLKAATRPN